MPDHDPPPPQSPSFHLPVDSADEMPELMPKLRRLRWVTVVLGVGNVGLILLGGYLVVVPLWPCSGDVRLPFLVVPLVAAVRLLCMVGAGMAQVATAATIVNYPPDTSAAVDVITRHERRIRYKRWLWWTRLGMGVNVMQFISALYLMVIIVKVFSYDGNSKGCCLGQDTESPGRKRMLIVLFLILAWFVAIIQCFTGSDVLRWRSFYATHDNAWKAHYLEVFDYGIREALCCLGRVKYLSVLEEDEVYSVARLLGDLVAYRASGTGHLEFLAGLALLQMHKESPNLYGELLEAPEARIREAAAYHRFAEAAYTGPLLDFGRNPILFPCAWIYRQSLLTPWTRNRRPVLEGDNWWRGHASAFLKYNNLPPDALRQGRVRQTRREASYFVVVLHQLRSIVVAVRGTETPEDLLTDGLCRECVLTHDDLDGLINGYHLDSEIRESLLSSPHYGHSGIVESARELFKQVDGQPEDKDGFQSKTTGLLSSLLGAGKECHGYRLCIVGHSLGGSVAALLGIRLHGRFPNLHVYAYGPLPCVDSVVAEACTEFVTSIVNNDEFSARLSISSIMRLRTAAIAALSDDSSANSAMICKLARRILHVNKHQDTAINHNGPDMPTSVTNHSFLTKSDGCKFTSSVIVESKDASDTRPFMLATGQDGNSLFDDLNSENTEDIDEIRNRDILDNNVFANTCHNIIGFEGSRKENHVSCFINDVSPSVSTGDSLEVFLPGLVILMVPEQRSIFSLWKNWRIQDRKGGYRAFVAKQESFKDIIVTPYMFLDHLPWRCRYAMQKVLETRKAEGQLEDDSYSGLDAV